MPSSRIHRQQSRDKHRQADKALADSAEIGRQQKDHHLAGRLRAESVIESPKSVTN